MDHDNLQNLEASPGSDPWSYAVSFSEINYSPAPLISITQLPR